MVDQKLVEGISLERLRPGHLGQLLVGGDVHPLLGILEFE